MSAHVSAEHLSAYLDRELASPEARDLEGHLDQCPRCRARLESLSRVLGHLDRLERATPPVLLAHEVSRRVALERDLATPRGLVERIERRLSGLDLQSPLFVTFAVIFALAVIVYLFAETVETIQHKSIPVRVASPETAVELPEEAASSRRAAGRSFELVDGAWRQQGLEAEPEQTISATSPEGREILARHPDLEPLLADSGAVILAIGPPEARRAVELVSGGTRLP